MSHPILSIKFAAFLIAAQLLSPPNPASPKPQQIISSTQATTELLSAARASVEHFFGEKFPKPFDIKVFPDRSSLTEFAKKNLGLEDTQCWMVAMGVSSMLVLLAPD